MSKFEDPVIITCSISGAVANRDQCPAIPYTPEEYAAEARRIVDEGGAMIHIHARTPGRDVPSYEVEDFRNITDAILSEVGDVIINYSTGAVGVPIEKRIEYLRELRPEVAALNMGSMNYAKYSRAPQGSSSSTRCSRTRSRPSSPSLNAMNELGIKPEHECFDSGHIANLDPLLDMGLLREPLQVSCVMGVTGGIRPTARNLAHMSEQVPGGAEGPNNWGVIGISRDQWMLGAAALTLGGNFRVGLEDNFYLPDGEMARSNGDLIAKARQMVEDVGRRAGDGGRGARDARYDENGVAAEGGGDGGGRWRRGRRPMSGPRRAALAGVGARPHAAAAGRLLHAAARRPRRRGAEGRGHGRRRLHPLDAALLRRRGGAARRRRSAYFLALNRNKRSLRLNLKDPSGREVLLRLVEDYDVLVESFRPGVMDKLGAGYEALRGRNPGVYCAISGYGQDGPYTERSGHDTNYLATTGLLGLTGSNTSRCSCRRLYWSDYVLLGSAAGRSCPAPGR